VDCPFRQHVQELTVLVAEHLLIQVRNQLRPQRNHNINKLIGELQEWSIQEQEHLLQITNGLKMFRGLPLIHLPHTRLSLGKCGYQDQSPNLVFLQAHLPKSHPNLALAIQS
jgi:hypothetical protein